MQTVVQDAAPDMVVAIAAGEGQRLDPGEAAAVRGHKGGVGV